MQIGELGAMDSVLLDVGRNQKRLTSLSGQLSSGLRINSAVDDPSGLGIAGRLQTISSGLGQGRQSIQEANNLLTVADGAMSTIADILQRMRSLVIEANSSLDSPQDQANLQAEIDQLTLEINRVAENTTFNGLNLFDGSLRSTPPNAYNQTLFIINPNTDGGTGLGAPQNPPSGPPLIDPTQPNTQSTPGAAPIEVSFTVNSFDSTTGTVNITWTAESPDASFGPAQSQTYDVGEGTNYPAGFPPGSGQVVITDQNGNPVFAFTFNDFNRNDVGKTAVVATIPVQDYTHGHGLDVNLGSAEGDVTQIQVPALSALNLGVSEIRLGDLLANQAAEGRIGNALEEITSARAAIGAELAATNYAATDASEQVLEQTASESSIRDLNVGRAATDYTRRQLLVSIGSSVLSQMEIDTKQLTAILVTALVA